MQQEADHAGSRHCEPLGKPAAVTFGFWGVVTFGPTYVGTVATKMGFADLAT
jgi:hypothetical protein